MKLHLLLWLGIILLLIGCTNPAPAVPTATVAPTIEITPTATTVPTPTPTPLPRDLTVCIGTEPRSLYPYADPSGAAALIREALYDGPIDILGYAYHPVILEKLPSLADGDARVAEIAVARGDRVIDSAGNITPLVENVRVRPAGCRDEDCAVTYDGSPLTMDQLSASFTLKPDLRWADETPVTAADSVFSFELAREATEIAAPWFEERTASYIAQDERTVTWTGIPGFLPGDYALTFWTPLPEHAWRYYSPEEVLGKPDVNRTPWGYGAYLVEAWEDSAHIQLRRNPHYYRAAEDLPNFDQLTFRFIDPRNPAMGLDALEDGRCDVLTADTNIAEDWERLQALETEGKARVYVTAGPVWEHITFRTQAGANDTRPLFFADARTRQAAAHCLDRARLIDEVLGGLSPVPDAYVPAEHPYVPDDITRYAFDPDHGAALLEAAGWHTANDNDVREARGIEGIPDGTRLNVLYRTTTSALHREISARVVDDLAWCGFEVFVDALEPAEFYATGAGSPLYGRDFDMAGFAWLGGVEPACELYNSAHIPGSANHWDGDNVGGYHNPDYDALCHQALSTLPGEAEHASAHRAALRLFGEELPALPILLHPRISATRPDLGGFQVDPLAPETWAIEVFEIVPPDSN